MPSAARHGRGSRSVTPSRSNVAPPGQVAAAGVPARRRRSRREPVDVVRESAISASTALGSYGLDRIAAWTATSPFSEVDPAVHRRDPRRAAGREGRLYRAGSRAGRHVPPRRLHSTKAWVQTAHAPKRRPGDVREARRQVGAPQLDIGAANVWKDGVSKQMTGGVALLFKANGVEWVAAPAASRTRTRSPSRGGGRDVPLCDRRHGLVPDPAADPRSRLARAASTRPGCSRRRRCRAGSSSSAAASSAASSRRSSSASAPR